MVSFVIATILLVVAVLAIVMRKTYTAIPKIELKRRAAKGDDVAKQLYRAASYGQSLDIFLWFVIALSSAGGFILFTTLVPGWLAFFTVVVCLVVFYEVLPAGRLTALGGRITEGLTPVVATVLTAAHPLLGGVAYRIEKHYIATNSTGLYERDDLLKLIERQLKQPDSRFSAEELMIVAQTLSFNDYTVHDILTPWASIKTVAPTDVVGPVLIDEAHRSGQPALPIIEKHDSKVVVVGLLRVQQLGIKSDGTVKDHLEQVVHYLHEDDTLTEALHAFYVTNQSLFIVLDSAGNYVGIVTMAALLQQLLGEIPGASEESYREFSDIQHRHDRTPLSPDDLTQEESAVVPDETMVE